MNGFVKNIRRALGVTASDPERLEVVRKHLDDHARNLIPERALRSHPELVDNFIKMLESVEATVAHLSELADVASEVARYMIVNDLAHQLKCGADKLIGEIDWSEQSDLVIMSGPATGEDVLSLTHAFAGVSETGTLFVASGPENPVTLSFLPETNIVLIRVRDIVGSYEDAWLKLPWGTRGPQMPRTVNFISGPSRTADIEQTLITGAHGPCHLHVIVVG
ncbi:MAG: lactate utilization protein C [bacterium]|nr:lactate utilization protein C [bacterium]